MLLVGCTNSPEEYRLTSKQLAWQSYQAGQVLRFAQRPAGPVRTYRITGVEDHLERQPTGINFTILPSRKIDCQHVTVTAQRTDTTALETMVLDFRLSYYAGNINFRPAIGWQGVEASREMPIDSVNKGAAFDSLQYPGVQSLKTISLGGTTYAPVLRISPFALPATPANGTLRMLYYAKGAGVVAFEEVGIGLWYRLP
ncbi:hypothetical protein QMK33_08105 [Hymenobacter sp. H14-R3]|uniref:hypothetical protein n=1 Tax=Hymenobacter sp. H14-R3 TaxID=3046308 RepID=UPI0024BA5397|nr:hypothetical protein [Hymenobacter sp. H14-R3]MDJ0365113.1 hypothetical protein [Hymenobacter sp. H14-R3]